jgi:dimethylargininase
MSSSQRPSRAIVRRPSPLVAGGEVTHIDRAPMDVARACEQHAAYVELLRSLGLTIVVAPDAPEHPDGLFVEDALLVIDNTAIITRPGALSRRGETATIEPLVRDLGLDVHVITEPATLDGGDVLVTDRHVFVGISTRTNQAAVDQLDAITRPLGRPALGAVVNGCLHLKSAITALPDGSLIAIADWIDVKPFEQLGYTVHLAADHTGGDLLAIGDTVIAPDSAAPTVAKLRGLGFHVTTIDVGELQKIESGVTCMSVLLR